MNLVRSWPQGQAGPTPLGWRLPQPLMPPRVNGWPMGVVPSSDAEGLLESAVAWWDASRYRQGDRFLRNQGVAGELLDLRLGSSAVANTNDPTWLGVEDSGYAYLPGVNSNNMSVPHVAGTQVGDVMEFRIDVEDVAWTTDTGLTLFGKATGTTTATRSWVINTATSNRIVIVISDGTATVVFQPTVINAPPFTTSNRVRLRYTYTRDTGAGQYAIGLDYSTDFTSSLSAVSSWISLSTDTGASIGATQDVNTQVFLGAFRAASAGVAGKYYGGVLIINGTTVLDIDCDAITSGSQTSFTALTGQTVTINRSTSGRKSVAQPRRGTGRATFLLGTDDYFEVPADRVWQHQLLNFGAKDSFTVLAVVRQWGTPVSSGHYIAKANTIPMWKLTSFGTAIQARLVINDGATQVDTAVGASALAAGTLDAIAATVDRSTQVGTVYQNGTAGTGRSISAVGSLANAIPLSVGRQTASTYQDMEFVAAAVFRRALTPAEITSITRYYGAS